MFFPGTARRSRRPGLHASPPRREDHVTKRDIVHSHHSTIYDLAVYEKAPDYFKVRVEIEVSSSNYHIKDHGFDLMVF